MVEIPEQLKNEDYRFIKLKTKDKIPIETEWVKKNNYRYDSQELMDHINNGGNYGVVCGHGGLIVLDADSQKLRDAIKDNLPETLTVKTGGGGQHYYYLTDKIDKVVLSNGTEHCGELQGWGSQVVGATCVHPNGQKYEITTDHQIEYLARADILSKIGGFFPEKKEIKVDKQEYDDSLNITDIVDTSRLKKRGNEYQGAHPIHGSDTGQNFTLNPNKNVCYCFRHNIGYGTLGILAVEKGIISCGEHLRGDKFKETLEIARKEYGLVEPTPDISDGVDIEEEIKMNGLKKVRYSTATKLMEDCRYATLLDTEEILHYREGVYIIGGEQQIKKGIQKIWSNNVTTHDVSEMVGHIKRLTYTPREDFTSAEDEICVKNGILNLRSGDVTPFDPEKKHLNKIPVTYDKTKKCEKIHEFLKQVLHEEDIPTVYELLGFCLYKSYFIHKAFMFVGEGANGKSTLINVMRGFLGNQNCSSISLQDLGRNRFAKGWLFGKLANLFADLDAGALKGTGDFKLLTGQDEITTDQKFRGTLTFKNNAVLIFSANTIPKTPDTTQAFFRRWIILNFPHRFEGKDADKELIKKLVVEDEMSGLLNEAITGLQRLFDNGDFTTNKSSAEWEEQYTRMSDPVGAFAMDCITSSPEDYISKEELYNHFIDYCNQQKLPLKAKNTFSMELSKHAKVEEYRPLIDGRRVTCYRGIVFTPYDSTMSNTTEEENSVEYGSIADIEDRMEDNG